MAMEAVDKRLVRRNHALIQLLDPPFDKSDLNPGYIKGYVPGVRENGGQYTHAAIWAAMAFAALGDRRRAWELMTMINPVNHARSPEAIAVYKVEPYVVLGRRLCALAAHRPRWMDMVHGLGRMDVSADPGITPGPEAGGDKLRFAPCLPVDWKAFKVHYRYRETVYHVDVLQIHVDDGETTVAVDGVERHDKVIPLIDDGQEHSVEVRIPAPRS